MNNKLRIALLCFIGTLSFMSCHKIDDGSFVEPITLYEKVKGSWTLSDVLQIDETAKTAGIQPDQISLYDQFDFSTFEITLDVDADNRPTAYRVDGNAPELFPSSGFWDLDTDFPRAAGPAPVINLYSDAGKTSLIGQLNISAMPGANPVMDLTLTRKTAGVSFVSYQYKLSKAN
ncbi:MAG: DUF5004 domain-containing protein [Parapedobacter sp.]|nr:MAG: DUF5004 domain-containing protein [Parapedobacter sp.]